MIFLLIKILLNFIYEQHATNIMVPQIRCYLYFDYPLQTRMKAKCFRQNDDLATA